jgi:hypothetical protein
MKNNQTFFTIKHFFIMNFNRYILLGLIFFTTLLINAQNVFKPANFKVARQLPLKDVPFKTYFDVTHFGAIPNDNKSDSKAIEKALLALEKSKGNAKLFFPKGVYNIGSENNNPYSFSLNGVSDFVLEGDSATILMENPTQAFLELSNCKLGIIKGFSVDYKTLPFTQGTITEVNPIKNTFVFEADHIGSLPTDQNFVNSKIKWGTLYDKNRKTLKNNAPNLIPVKSIEKSNIASSFQITTTPSVIQYIEKGDPFAIIARYNGRSTYKVKSCYQITFMNNTNFAGPAGGFGLRESSNINILNCNVLRKEGRLISQNADCVHVTPGYIGPWIENCIFEGQMDDAINIKTELSYILAVLGKNEFLVSADLQQGDSLSLFNPREGILIGICKVIKSSRSGERTIIQTDKEFSSLNVGTGKDKDMFFNQTKANQGFVIKNNTFRNSRRYGILIQAKNGIIEGNRMENLSTGAITLQNSASWPEGFVPSDVLIKDNTIINCGFDKSYWAEGENVAPVLIRTTTCTKGNALWKGVQRIEIINNNIKSNSKRAIYLNGAKDIKIENNHSSALSSDLYFQENCSNIEIR